MTNWDKIRPLKNLVSQYRQNLELQKDRNLLKKIRIAKRNLQKIKPIKEEGKDQLQETKSVFKHQKNLIIILKINKILKRLIVIYSNKKG